MIRFADVLLMVAECQIETNAPGLGQANINLIRARAANPAGFVKMPDGSNAANYVISEYTTPFAIRMMQELLSGWRESLNSDRKATGGLTLTGGEIL